jgi:FMN phosphatase YigB (HAD superfamily)
MHPSDGANKGFFFDLDGTLLKAPEEDFYETLRELELPHDLEEVYTAYYGAREWYRQHLNVDRTGEEIWRDFAAQVLLRLGFVESPPSSLMDRIQASMARREPNRLFPDTQSMLRILHDKGFFLAIISSRPILGVEEKLAFFDLRRYFSCVIARESVRQIKPSPLPFFLALAQSGLRPNEALYVGDTPEEDLAGAQAIGIRAYIVDRRGRFPPAPYLLKDLYELLAREGIA